MTSYTRKTIKTLAFPFLTILFRNPAFLSLTVVDPQSPQKGPSMICCYPSRAEHSAQLAPELWKKNKPQHYTSDSYPTLSDDDGAPGQSRGPVWPTRPSMSYHDLCRTKDLKLPTLFSKQIASEVAADQHWTKPLPVERQLLSLLRSASLPQKPSLPY